MGLLNKTEQQQILHSKMLAETRDILEKHGVTPILTGSALLGITRDGELVPWCPGVVFTVKYHEIHEKGDNILIDLENAGFKIVKYRPGMLNYKIRIDRDGLNVEIVGYFRHKKKYIRRLKNKVKIIPCIFLDSDYNTVELRGEKYKTPGNIEGFLNFVYKDWRTPIKSSSPSVYKSKRHMVITK